MKVLFWNIRGLGKKSRVGQLKDLMARERIDIVGLQETIKQDFSLLDLLSFSPGGGLFGIGYQQIGWALRGDSGGGER